MFAENIGYLYKQFPLQCDIIKSYEQKDRDGFVSVVQSKCGEPSALIGKHETRQYLHSKYDPISEAMRFADKIESQISELTESSSVTMEIRGLGATQKAFKNGDSYSHILFYGVGMGYHIDEILRRLPNLRFSIYEPKPEIFYHFLSARMIGSDFYNRLDNIYLETSKDDMDTHLNQFLNDMNGHVILISLPSYERIFKENYEKFLLKYREKIRSRRSDFHTNLAFEKRWTINGIKNLPEVIKTPNILHDINREYFVGKPVLLVAAGPSLTDEIENIRYIKENRLAYIFSVGSAIKALLKNNIYPDCVLSYDPGENTQNTYKELNELGITSIPLIFGSTVGFETLKSFLGPKLHMITTQDSVASTFLKHNSGKETVEKVSDAPSIAVVTLELLSKLGANPIILVGQNFAFKKQQFYADGISYGSESEKKHNKRAESKLIQVDDVYGGKVYTESTFLQMKEQMEKYTELYSKKVNIINTTKGGAHIRGTLFYHLEEVISNKLLKPVVNKDWINVESISKYNLSYICEKQIALKQSLKELKETTTKITKILQGMNENKNKKNNDIVIRSFSNLDRTFQMFTANEFFQIFLLPMNRVRFELMMKNVSNANKITNVLERINVVMNEVTLFVYCCKVDYEKIEPMFNDMIKKVEEIGSTDYQQIIKN